MKWGQCAKIDKLQEVGWKRKMVALGAGGRGVSRKIAAATAGHLWSFVIMGGEGRFSILDYKFGFGEAQTIERQIITSSNLLVSVVILSCPSCQINSPR